jgi:hypothetical protein
MPPAGFKPPIPKSGRPQTHALDRASTGIGINLYLGFQNTLCLPARFAYRQKKSYCFVTDFDIIIIIIIIIIIYCIS